jgi:hypothetical protein
VAERETRKFILAKVEDTWVRELKDAATFYTKVQAIDLLQHLQSTCLGTHAIDALSLQIEMREFHKTADGIPEYINMLEDAQRTALRMDKNNPITDQSVLTIAINAMLSTQQFPRTNDEYEALDVANKTWPTWKTMYKKAQGKERVRVKAVGGKSSFGANAATSTSSGSNAPSVASAPFSEPRRGEGEEDEPFTLSDLEACFDNLANAARAERSTLDELVKSNSVLTTTNSELAKTNKSLTNEVNSLQRQVNALKKKGGDRGSSSRARAPRASKKKCSHCSGDHASDDCFELPANAGNRPAGWASKL